VPADIVKPGSIGRYEIVGRLATGGMAEVLLGRIRGPHGFERPVVIKRILPHLALDPAVVELFLDEAKIIANLRHPNLINVHELGHERGELFMAMEFLEGESLSGLCRRLANRGEVLDFDLVAHIVAEACAGLHAAHEATSPDGRPLEIVHRDVSPQNIFLSYSGAVHVIDFGIATTADHVGRTEAGTIRGKFEYLAPEQLQSLPVDRRADVYALGVVLFELASGRRAFKRASQGETVLAVLTDPLPQIGAFRPEVPARLEEICGRAFARSRRDRYEDAAAMRRELLAFTRKRTQEDLGERCGKLMRDLFADRIAEKGDMLRRVRQGNDVETLPAAEVDSHVELPTAMEQTMSTGSLVSQSIPIRLPSGRRSRRAWVAALVGAVAIGAGMIGWRSTVMPRTSAPSPVAAAPGLLETQQTAPVAVAQPEPTTPAAATDTTPPSAPRASGAAADAKPRSLPGARPGAAPSRASARPPASSKPGPPATAPAAAPITAPAPASSKPSPTVW
jgi:serine/threonine-protein kinase